VRAAGFKHHPERVIPSADGTGRVDVSAEEFRALFQAVSNWGRWGEDDELGTLNELSPDRIAAATKLVGTGEAVTLSHPLDTVESVDNPQPADHHMTLLPDVDIGSGPLRFAKDYVGVDYHNDTHTHIDALCHVALDGAFYNGKPSADLTETAAGVNTIEAVKNGLVGRGVLLDVPRLRGVPWLEPGEHVFREDLEAAEREQGVTVERGDILLVRTGHARRLRELGPWETATAKAGLHPTTVLYLAERRIAVLGSDTNGDTAPSTTEGIAFPIHALTLNAMGLHLIDYLQFEDLRPACERAGRWEFLFVAAPLRIVGGTGSPLNPIAIL
jgi:kynurenine formamidase